MSFVFESRNQIVQKLRDVQKQKQKNKTDARHRNTRQPETLAIWLCKETEHICERRHMTVDSWVKVVQPCVTTEQLWHTRSSFHRSKTYFYNPCSVLLTLDLCIYTCSSLTLKAPYIGGLPFRRCVKKAGKRLCAATALSFVLRTRFHDPAGSEE